MRVECAGDEAEAANEKNQHDESIEEAGGTKIDMHIGDNASKDEKRAGNGEEPAGGTTTVPEENANAQKHGHKSDAEGIRAKKTPKGTNDADLIGKKISP